MIDRKQQKKRARQVYTLPVSRKILLVPRLFQKAFASIRERHTFCPFTPEGTNIHGHFLSRHAANFSRLGNEPSKAKIVVNWASYHVYTEERDVYRHILYLIRHAITREQELTVAGLSKRKVRQSKPSSQHATNCVGMPSANVLSFVH